MAKKGGAPTKSEVLTHISKDTGLSRKQIGGVFDSLSGVIKKSLRGNGLFTMPGLLKMKVVKKPATKAREGVNPFTGQKMMFKAKPATKKVRVMPLKSLKGNGELLRVHAFRINCGKSPGEKFSRAFLFLGARRAAHEGEYRLAQVIDSAVKEMPGTGQDHDLGRGHQGARPREHGLRRHDIVRVALT